ncbi:MAG: peptidoglycan DD-metalloendopeptidase family protein [Fermentimonas sp.]|nr:peptidoglycan DD-metalloendopeptidase family protein [Fermentimonas sp.]
MKKLILISFLSSVTFLLFSQTVEIEDLQRQQQAIQEDIRNTNKLYLDVKKQTTTILERINLINKQISSRKELISVQRREIEALRKEEERLETEIERLNKELNQKKDNYADAIKGMFNQKLKQNKLLFILSGKTFGESLRRMQYLREYSKWQRSQADEIKKQNAEIVLKKDALILAKAEKEKALASLQDEQKKLQGEEKIRQTEISQTRGQEQKLRQSLQQKQRQADQLNSQIEKLIAEEVSRQEREEEARRLAEAKKQSKKPSSDTKIPESKETPAKAESADTKKGASPVIDPGASKMSTETFNLSKNFAANKGKLPMPVTGASSIVGNFGTKRHSEWNVTTNSNGIDIQAEKGADIRSVFDGEVSKVFSFPGSNTCVIVRHGDYYTFYANIYDLFVKQGDKVKAGQSLGRIFTDPDTGISTMHFQLWQKTSKINPAPWLNRG